MMTSTPGTFRYDAFLSYRRREADRAFARNLVAQLERAGFTVAIDERDFRAEQTFLEEMERCVRESRFTLAVLSPAYLASGACVEEAIFCRVLDLGERRRRLVPLILERVERPTWLYGIVGIDFTDGQPLVQPFDRLLQTLGTPSRGSGVPVAPNAELRFPDERTRATAEALERAYCKQEDLVSTGGDTTAIQQQILALRRELREGGRLQAGDFLAGGRFRLLEQLGRGGFSTVWKAFDRERRDLVAVKVLHSQHVGDYSRRERFFRGARMMAKLHHSGIVHVLEPRLDDGGFHFFVMEFLPGGDLRAAVLGKRLATGAAMLLLQDVAAALAYAHGQGVIHRDIKPANILLNAAGRPKLTDFDLVRAADTTGGTMEGGMLGTFLYAAPEAMSSPQDCGVAADVYSFAMTVAFCLYKADLPPEVLRNTESFLRRLGCPAGLQAVLLKALDWEPTSRFSSMEKLAQALAEGLATPISTKPLEKVSRQATVSQPESESPSLRSDMEDDDGIVAAPEAALPLIQTGMSKRYFEARLEDLHGRYTDHPVSSEVLQTKVSHLKAYGPEEFRSLLDGLRDGAYSQPFGWYCALVHLHHYGRLAFAAPEAKEEDAAAPAPADDLVHQHVQDLLQSMEKRISRHDTVAGCSSLLALPLPFVVLSWKFDLIWWKVVLYGIGLTLLFLLVLTSFSINYETRLIRKIALEFGRRFPDGAESREQAVSELLRRSDENRRVKDLHQAILKML